MIFCKRYVFLLVVRAKLTGPWEGGGVGGKNIKLWSFFSFFLGIFGTKVFINSTFFEWFRWMLWRKNWWCCYFCSQKWQFKVSINISKSRHQILLLFIRFCYWNPNKKGRENVSDASGQKWKISLGEGCDRLIKCSNPN